MVFQPEHSGLYFGQAQIENAQKNRESDAYLQSAWQWLRAKDGDVVREIKPEKKGDEPTLVHKPALSGLDAALANGFRYRFLDDAQAGAQAATALQLTLQDKSTLLETIMATVSAAHLYEMVHPLADVKWKQDFAAYADTLMQADEPIYLERVWLITLGIVAGIVLDDEARFNHAIEQFKHIIEHDIHPEGYFKPLVDDELNATFREMLLAVSALVLAAEASTQAGFDLWAYTSRDVSISTTIPYLVYYYFYPEKWHWKDEFTEEDTRQLFQQYGAFIEMATYRQHPRGVDILLDLQRPLFSAMTGGLTTLSHAKAPKKRRWFGF